MTEIKAPEGGRPVSELQERLARAIYESRYGRPERDDYWHRRVKDMREIAEMFPNAPLGGDGVSDAFRDALAAMKAMRDPTRPMVDAGVAYALNVTVSGAGSWSEYVAAKHQNMMQAEISIAEGGKNNAD